MNAISSLLARTKDLAEMQAEQDVLDDIAELEAEPVAEAFILLTLSHAFVVRRRAALEQAADNLARALNAADKARDEYIEAVDNCAEAARLHGLVRGPSW